MIRGVKDVPTGRNMTIEHPDGYFISISTLAKSGDMFSGKQGDRWTM